MNSGTNELWEAADSLAGAFQSYLTQSHQNSQTQNVILDAYFESSVGNWTVCTHPTYFKNYKKFLKHYKRHQETKTKESLSQIEFLYFEFICEGLKRPLFKICKGL